jgi:two-component system, cell cycle sensor histidine kinase and response regulator CckA
LHSIRHYFSLPLPEDDPEKALVVRIFNSVCLSMTVLLVVLAIGTMCVFVRKTSVSITLVLALLLLLIAYALAYRDRIRVASAVLVCGLWVLCTVQVWLTGEVNTVIVGTYVGVAAISGMLLGPVVSTTLAVLSCGTALGMVLLPSLGYVLPHYYPMPPWSAWFVLVFLLVLTVPAVNETLRGFSVAWNRVRGEIEERKKAEGELKESEERYRNFFDTSRDPVFMTTPAGKLIDLNDAALEMLGFAGTEREEVLQRSVDSFYLRPEDRKTHAEQISEQGFSKEYPVDLVKRDGTIIHALVTTVARRNSQGCVVGFQGTIRDITERKLAEEMLRNTLHRFYTILSSMYAGVLIVTEDGRVEFVNQAFCDLFLLDDPPASLHGLTSPEMVGKIKDAYANPMEALARIRDVVARNAPIKGEEIAMTQGRACMVDYVPITAGGKPCGRLWHHIDITGQKRAEQRLKESEAQVRLKLESILLPEGDTGTLELTDVIDVHTVQSLMDDFFSITGIGVSLLDLSGKILVATGWQDICTRFHRVHPESRKNCIESDTQLPPGIEEGDFKLYQCKNHLWHAATPVLVGGKHLGNVFLGQFLFEEEVPVRDLFRAQANQYGFDEQEYLDALDRAPRWSKDTVDRVMGFYTKMTRFLSSLSYSNIKLARILAERERLVASLQESEEKYRTLFNNAEVGMFRTRLDGSQILDLNEKFLDIFGYTREEMEGSPSLTHWVDPHEREELVRRLHVEGRVTDFECKVRNKYGEERTCTTSLRLYPEQGILEGSTIDVTELKKAEEALRESEDRYRQIADNSLSGIFVYQNGRGVYANRRLAEIVGYSPEEILRVPFLEAIHPEDRQMVREMAKGRLAGEPVPNHYELRLLHKNGSTVWSQVLAHKINYQGGPAILGNVADVTESRLLEEQLRQAQKMEAVGTLAGGIAHDFNNLLQIISGNAELLDMEHAERGTTSEELEAIRRAATRGADLVRQILTFSRRVDANFESINLNEEVQSTARLLSRTIPKMIDIETQLQEGLERIRGDCTQIEQMLINLTVNAKDAMPEGGKLTIETRNAHLDGNYCRAHPETIPGRYVLLKVSDTGEGIEDEVRQHIFEPFFTTKGLAQGTGLGLSAVFGIVKIHGGHITCESQVGKGTTFTICFPVAREIKPAPEETQGVAAVAGGTETILLADDEELIRNLAKRTLENAGYSVIACKNGKEALEIYRTARARVALVILDLIMPEMGGRQCLQELLKIDPQVKVLIASGFAVQGETKDFIDDESEGMVSKPFKMIELLHAVRRVLDGLSYPL